MADTEKQNFRYPVERWREAMAKMEKMRRAGFDIDMTKVLGAEVDRVLGESADATARRLGLVAGEAPAAVWRKPFARAEAEQ